MLMSGDRTGYAAAEQQRPGLGLAEAPASTSFQLSM